MRKITIIGAGQSGLYLAIGLQKLNYEVCLISNRSAQQIAQGSVLSSQCIFADALDLECQQSLHFWQSQCPSIDGIELGVMGSCAEMMIKWKEKLSRPAQSVDQRIKIPAWMQHFIDIGGELLVHNVQYNDLENYAKKCDLLIVATGRGAMNQIFLRNDECSQFSKPMRSLALTYVHGMSAPTDFRRLEFNIIPQVGECFTMPALSVDGPCDIMIFEGLIGGPMDCWRDVETSAQHLQRSKAIIEKYLPAQFHRYQHIELTDSNGVLSGCIAPTVRHPIGRLASGTNVLGMGDALVVNDPITGQGANNAIKCAEIYLQSIVNKKDGVFDEVWMQHTFNRYWEYARWVADWTSLFLNPPPKHVLKLLDAAQNNINIRRAIVDGFNHPPSYFPWFSESVEADAFIAKA